MKAFVPLILVLAELSAAYSPTQRRADSSQWIYTCAASSGGRPYDFKAFNLPDCSASLTFNKKSYLGVVWTFEAIYADGSRVTHEPFTESDNFGVSDPVDGGLQGRNFDTLISDPSSPTQIFTVVHDFLNVCQDGAPPVAWTVYASSPAPQIYKCQPVDYRYTSGSISVAEGVFSRPAQVSGVTLARVNNNGDFQVSWDPVPGVEAYSVLLRFATGRSEGGIPYRNVRGARIYQTTAAGLSTSAIVPTGNDDRNNFEPRSAIVHAVDSAGVWSFAGDVQPVDADYETSITCG